MSLVRGQAGAKPQKWYCRFSSTGFTHQLQYSAGPVHTEVLGALDLLLVYRIKGSDGAIHLCSTVEDWILEPEDFSTLGAWVRAFKQACLTVQTHLHFCSLLTNTLARGLPKFLAPCVPSVFLCWF